MTPDAVPVTQRFIETHGGTIEIGSSVDAHDHGTDVTASLPLLASPHDR